MDIDVDAYIGRCRTNYFEKITPSNPKSKSTAGYLALVKIAQSFFERNEYEKFSYFFQEGQYFIQLWTAHMILEYGKPSETYRKQSMRVIRKYSDNEMAPEVSIEEQLWLAQNENKFKESF